MRIFSFIEASEIEKEKRGLRKNGRKKEGGRGQLSIQKNLTQAVTRIGFRKAFNG